MMALSYEELLREDRELRAELAGLSQENRRLREENRALRAIIADLKGEVTHLREELARFQEENKRLKEDPPSVVKPPRKAEPKKPGRKPGHPGSARPIPSKVDEEQELTLDCCPDCGSPLSGPQEERVRYVEDLLPPRLHVTKYRIKRYWCPHCKRLVERKPTDVLLGHQLGIHMMSEVVYLREELRLPVNLVQRYLERAGLRVSLGEIEWICTEVAEHLRPLYEGYRQQLREGEAANMDETGMRIEGENQWLWAGERKDSETVVFHHDEHRSSAVVDELLGEEFSGVLGSDFYSAYNSKAARKHEILMSVLATCRERGEERTFRRQLRGC